MTKWIKKNWECLGCNKLAIKCRNQKYDIFFPHGNLLLFSCYFGKHLVFFSLSVNKVNLGFLTTLKIYTKKICRSTACLIFQGFYFFFILKVDCSYNKYKVNYQMCCSFFFISHFNFINQ
jgi:hypothetical protein